MKPENPVANPVSDFLKLAKPESLHPSGVGAYGPSIPRKLQAIDPIHIDANLNWFVEHSAELFPGEAVILPLKESCVHILAGKRMLVCAVVDCPSVIDPQTPASHDATYICKIHTLKTSRGVFFQKHAFDKGLGFINSQGAGSTRDGAAGGNGRGSELRKFLDAREPFMTRGNQPAKTREIDRKWSTPDWMFDDQKVAEFLRLRFPKIVTDEQRQRVSKWAGVIQNYFRLGTPAGERAKQSGVDAVMNWKPGTTEAIVLKIRRFLNGKNQANGRRKSTRRRGRPRKSFVTRDLMAA